MLLQRLLFAGLSMLRESHSTSPSTTVLDVLLKVCWSTRYLMQIVDVDHASTVALFSMLCNMFALLSEDELKLGSKSSKLDFAMFLCVHCTQSRT